MATLTGMLRIIPAGMLAIALEAAAVGTGDPAPPLALPDAKGATVSLADLKGKVVYVDFWASWCAPCRRSFPWMGEMQAKYGAQGLVVLAVNVDRKRADADRFLATTPGAFTIVFDPSGATPTAWNVKGMPTSYLVDRRGRVVHVDAGFRDDMKPALEAKLKAALEK
jgi:thiol-disulfide isomerase/thioredoxin